MITEKQIIDRLRSYTNSHSLGNKNRYGIHIYGELIYIGKVKVYSSPGKARGQIINMYRYAIALTKQTREDIAKIVDDLIEKKIIEIKPII